MASKSIMELYDISESMKIGGTSVRPHLQLSINKQMVYEDLLRSAQILGELHKFYQNGHFCDIVLYAESSRFVSYIFFILR